MRNVLLLFFLTVALGGSLLAQTPWTGDVLGSHNLGPGGTSPVKGQASAACLYCHAPHSGIGGRTPLWAQTLSSQTYSLYTSPTIKNEAVQPTAGASSSLCLSCHDGTVAVGTKVPGGTVTMTGSMSTQDIFGTELQSSHPFSLRTPLVDSSTLVDTLASTGITADPLHKVALKQGTVECTSCHEPHQQNLDPVSLTFLARDNANGQLCLACHTGTARTVNGRDNPLAQWNSSIHALSGNPINAGSGVTPYATVAQASCLSCHKSHTANGAAGLLRAPDPPAAGMDAATQSCMTCHNGGTTLQNPLPNVFAEFAKKGHPFPTGSAVHQTGEPVVLVNNRHATCADCHNAHSSFQVAAFAAPPAIRSSQTGVLGVSANDGTTVLPAANQYENCFRCHGTSPGKQAVQDYGYLPLRAVSAADRLNVIPEFMSTTSSHPVTHAASSQLAQPSLRSFMLNLDGLTPNSRALHTGTDRLFCTDCHNADDNREFGGAGPNGPHGSQYSHVLERRYEFSQVAPAAAPGTPIVNLFPNPDLSAGGATPGPYALCAKCHDLNNLMLNTSFSQHSEHVASVGVSCSVCHTAHGMGSLSPSIAGDRLVNFDVNVVAANGATPISYSRLPTTTCTLTCHGFNHNSDGSVTAAGAGVLTPVVKTVR